MKKLLLSLLLICSVALSAQNQFTELYTHVSLSSKTEKTGVIRSPSKVIFNYGQSHYILVDYGGEFLFNVLRSNGEGVNGETGEHYEELVAESQEGVEFLVHRYRKAVAFKSMESETVFIFMRMR